MHTETYSLQFPYTTSAGQRVESISLKRLKVKDIKAVKKISDDPSNWDDALLSRMTGLVPEDIDEMDAQDYMALQKRFQQLLGLDNAAGAAVESAGPAGEVVSLSAE
ncbi:phage tail assembly protein [Pectobacterium brasiliense]|uniref:Phage tail assembly protein n=5 Tax=Pectobacterium TaxID=122277 RepID=A0A3S1FM28_9GAMM|nr:MULTISPECIES: phage tail assembly protein [Pectobacterium]ASY79018.1 hypothetical protein BJK05_03000 [Pectobacterium polaris]KAA3667572.1 phage tail assembly protein [Pectobacterium carotovorum subsp. carotovorum]KFF63098.1 hypothetical protein IV99_16950 [Pectobacterium brasiliense]KGA22251.1 mu-like prophage FluMu gp41 family protein [Pectobacterium brasiliense]KHS91099.1 mu-like prophage FluMu gp41 family protein [Pectobacterium brasiliense]